jgi:DNA-binding SARP family transcriptional activator/tetratricopeptide (TPR) repeat protein
MGRLHLELLGGFSAHFEGGRPLVLPMRKAQALLAFLALPAGRVHSREKLTALLWGETSALRARQSFRQALVTLRRALAPAQPAALVVRGDTIALDPGAVVVDVADLEAAVADGGAAALTHAGQLYCGDLLDGFSLDVPTFDDWRAAECERLRELMLDGLARLLSEQLRTEAPGAAIQTALRMLAIDPLQEAVHRTQMRLLVHLGRRAAALQQYQVCVGWLKRELSTEPEEETRRLYREILRSAGASSPDAMESEPPAAALIGAVDVRLIGRAAQLEALQAALARMLDTGGRVVLVTGGAGIGKTRLIQEFVTQAFPAGVRVALARCHETEQALPLHPWIDALRGHRPSLDPAIRQRLDAAAASQLVRVFPELQRSGDPPVATSAQPALLFDAVFDLIGELSAAGPVVLVLEDLHWADAMSARLLAFVGRRAHHLPLLIVGTMRPEELVDAPVLAQALAELRGDGGLDQIALGLLSEPESRELVQALRPSRRAGRDWESIAGRIWAASEGNPFVIVESVRSLEPDVTEGLGSTRGRSIEDFVGARLDRLTEHPRHVVNVAAAIGRSFSFALLWRASRLSESEAADAVEHLVRRRLLDAEGDRLTFCHDWIRQVAYERLLPVQRLVLHGAIGQAMQTLHAEHLDDVADQLGHHYARAGDASKAIPHLIRFAELAADRYALDDAYRALQQALVAIDRLEPAASHRARLDVSVRQASVLSVLGRQREVLAALRACGGELKHVNDPRLASEYFLRLGITHFYLGEYADAQLAAEQALIEGERADDAERMGKALYVLALNSYGLGAARRGIDYATRAIPRLEGTRSQYWLGLVHFTLALNSVVVGALDAAFDAATRAREVGTTIHDFRLIAGAGYVTAWVHSLRGECEEAIRAAREAIDASRDPTANSLATGSLGLAYLELGDPAAVRTLEKAVEQLTRIPLRQGVVRHLVYLSEAHLLTGDLARARETAARAREMSQADEVLFNIGLVERAHGRIAQIDKDLPAAADLFRRALAAFTDSEATFETGRTHVDAAVVAAARGDVDAARTHFAAALAAFATAPAPRRAAATRHLMTALGLERPAS